MKFSGAVSEENTGGTAQVPADELIHSKRTFVATLAAAALMLIALEFRWPYYFLQDDGLEEFLPSYFHNWRSLLAGRLPLYDFHIFGGVPHASMGQPAVFYAPQYLAMSLSEAFWGHPFAAVDLMAFMHGLIAVAGGYVLLEYLGVSDMAAAFGALTALSGFFVWAGRMWPSVPMLCAWFPWMLWAALRYMESPSVRRAGWLVFFRLGLLYAGYPNFFVLALIFEHMFTITHSLARQRAHSVANYWKYVTMCLPTFLLGLPYILPGVAEAMRSIERSRPMPYHEFSTWRMPLLWWVFGQLFVFARVRVPKDDIGSAIPYLSHIGYLASLLPLGAAWLWKERPKIRPWIIASGACFLLALLWSSNVLGPLIYHLPLLNRCRWPFKLVFFAGFFQCLVAALVLTHLKKRWQRIVIAGFVANWIVVFCFLPNHAWRIRDYHPPLKSPWQADLADGRYFVISRGAVYHVSKQYVELDYAELWGLDNLLGYEPLLSRFDYKATIGKYETVPDLHSGSYDGPVSQQLLNHLRKWGVKYVLVGPALSYNSPILASAGFQLEVVKKGWTLWEDPKALPLIRWANTKSAAGLAAGIRWTEHINSIGVQLTKWLGRQLVFAFVANHGLETCIADHCTPVARSADGLIRVNVPPGTRHVRLVYHSALLLPSILIALATLLVYMLLLFRSRKVSSQQ